MSGQRAVVQLLVVSLLLFVEGLPVRAATTGDVRIIARCVNAANCDVVGAFLVRASGDDAAARRAPVINGVGQIAAPANDYQVDLEADGYWMPPQLTVSDKTTLDVPVWRTSVLRGCFSIEAGGQLPKTFTMYIQSPPSTKAGTTLPAGTKFECPVAADGSWQCAVPGVPIDITVRSKGFIPHYIWDLKLKPSLATDVGTIRLKHGASFVAWLDGTTAKSLRAPAKARLMRMTMANSPTFGGRLNQPVAEGMFNLRGVVQLGPVPPGTYVLEVTAAGFAPARLDNITIYEARESTLRVPIALDRPITIRLSVEPAHDPSGAPWRVMILRQDPLTFRGDTVADGTATNGTIQVAGQASGHYTVRIRDRYDNWYAFEEFDIQSDIDAQRTIRISLLHLHGKLTAAQQPITGHLVFGGHSGPQQIRTAADDDGSFDVTLPRPGKWTVDIENKDLGVYAVVTTSVAENDNELEIDLPDTEVAGWVTGVDRNRVADAVVTLYSDAGAISRRTEHDGSFRFRGMKAGLSHITAVDPRTSEQSRFLEIPITDGLHREDLELTLENRRSLKGRVTAQGQAVVGARITGYGFGTGMARQERTVSDVDGSFTLSFPPSATQVALIVAAAGPPLQAFSAAYTEAPIMLDLAPVGGVLRLRMNSGGSRPGITYNGTPIPLPELLEWARAQGSVAAGDVFEAPNVAPGVYQFCLTRGGKEICKEGRLAPNSVLVLGTE